MGKRVRSKFSQNLKDANLVANEMTNGKSLGTFIDRNEFADKFSSYQLGNIKGNFINETSTKKWHPYGNCGSCI